jgi:hypothetical protein
VTTGGSRSAQFPDRASDIERTTPTRVRIHHQRKVRRGRDTAYIFCHLIYRRHSKVRQAEGRIRYTRAGEINCFEPSRLGEQRTKDIDRSNHLQRPFFFDRRPKTATGRLIQVGVHQGLL